MSTHRPAPIELPVGPCPGWELNDSATAQTLKSISESSVIAYSLRQSREKWIFHTFPKFSSKARGNKASDPPHPPHSIQTLGKCDLELGPHIFPETSFYKVTYYSHTQSSWSSQSGTSEAPKPGDLNPSAPPAPPEGNTAGVSSSSSSFPAVTPITPTLINQVNSAASSNPILANLLQLAAAGKATPDQLKTLGILIQSLANLEKSPPARQFDLVLEFREALSERWLFPRTPAIYRTDTSRDMSSAVPDILLTVRVPFDQHHGQDLTSSQTSPATDPKQFENVTIRFHKPPAMIQECLSEWLGDGETKTRYDTIIHKLDTESVAHVFLPHHVSVGSLATQLQNAVALPYALKPVKQGPSTSRYSRAQRRKQSEQALKEQNIGKGEESAPTKRRQAARQKTTIQIQCMTCGQTDVPLILGGRFCRPCVDSGKFKQNAHPLNGSAIASQPLTNGNPILGPPIAK